MARTLFDKLLAAHEVRRFEDGTALVLVDRVMLHERTGSLALQALAERDRPLAAPAQVFAVMDHIVSTAPGRGDASSVPNSAAFVRAMRDAARDAGIRLFDIDDPDQGISHLVAAEQGIALPGLTMVCPDSHTCTLGALGMLAWGLGTSDCEHVLATETLRVRVPKTMQVWCSGRLPEGVTAKDLVLTLIGRYGAGGGAGYHLEYAGPAVQALGMAGRFTLCNMAVEFSAFSGAVGVDATTIDYLRDRDLAPAVTPVQERQWLDWASDAHAAFDRRIEIDCNALSPMVTWGTSPAQVLPLGAPVPDNADSRALHYMGLERGKPVADLPIDAAYIGSCTNARLDDLRAAAEIVRGRRVPGGITALVVPGSTRVRRAAEAEGLHEIFEAAGFEWRESGCGLCFYAGGEGFAPGSRVISTTNRNFQGRQGPGVRTHLASPQTVAASAVSGRIRGALGLAEAA